MSSAHFPGGPSAAPRRIQCSQSVTLEAMFPEDEDSEAAREGTAAHWAAAEQLSGRLVDIGVIAPNGVVLNDEMVKAADIMFDDVTRTLAPFGLKPTDGCVETRVAINRIYPDMFGTPDFFIVIAGKPMRLFLWDFKFGHRIVEVFENAQLVDYAAGIVGHVPDLDPGVEIVAKIVQPRAYHGEGPVREWRTTLLDLRALINISSNSAHEAFGPNPRARTGPECRDCRARHACPALQKGVYAGLDEARRVTPMIMPPAALGLERKMIDEAITLLEARRSGLDAQIEALLKAGKPVPGWRVEHGYGREAWVKPASEVIAVGAMLGVPLAKKTEAITPRQAREAGLDPAIVAQLSTRPRAAATLVEDDGTKWRRVFG